MVLLKCLNSLRHTSPDNSCMPHVSKLSFRAPVPTRSGPAEPASVTAPTGAPVKPAVADGFTGGHGHGSHGPVGRPAQAAVAFVSRFDAQLGLSADDLKQKLAHMASDPTHFLTAMPALFYQDVRGAFSSAASLRSTPAPTGLLVGDAHLGNLMSRPGPDDKTVWGWGDCDKSGRGPLEWDLDRLATDVVLTARTSKQSYSKGDERDLVDAVARGYTDTLREFAATGARPAGFLSRHETDGALQDFLENQKTESQAQFIDKRAPKGRLPHELEAGPMDEVAIRAAVASWASRLPEDAPVARPVKVLSTGVEPGSVGGSNSGLVKWLAVVAPANPKDPPVLLKFKQVLPSAPEVGSGDLSRSNAAQVVENANTLEGVRDPLLGYATIEGRSCLVQAERANVGILDPQSLHKKDLTSLALAAGVALARSQLQSSTVTRAQVGAWLGDPSTDAAASDRLVAFARSYADQTEADTKALARR